MALGARLTLRTVRFPSAATTWPGRFTYAASPPAYCKRTCAPSVNYRDCTTSQASSSLRMKFILDRNNLQIRNKAGLVVETQKNTLSSLPRSRDTVFFLPTFCLAQGQGRRRSRCLGKKMQRFCPVEVPGRLARNRDVSCGTTAREALERSGTSKGGRGASRFTSSLAPYASPASSRTPQS